MWVSTVLIEMNSSAADLLVGVAARDQPHHLALALGEAVEVLVDGGDLDGAGEGVEHEARQPRGEHGVPWATRSIAATSSGPVIVLVT